MRFRHTFSLISLAAMIIFVAGFGCTPQSTPEALQAVRPFTLNVWGVWDDSGSLAPVFSQYKKQFPHVNIRYTKLRYEEYEQALLEATADGVGPDVFAVHNTWVREYAKRLVPAPKTLRMPITKISGPEFQKKTYVELVDAPGILAKDVERDFVGVVAGDVLIDGAVYALPISLDTLALYYNRDLLDAAGIAEPPRTWLEFKEAVEALTAQDKDGNILQAGAAMGTTDNVPRSTDILSLLMMQNGAEMTSASGATATFHLKPAGSAATFVPGVDALRFYTDFASPSKVVYSWNDDMPDAFQAFTEGRLAFFFGYAYHQPLMKTQAPNIRVGVVNFPQITAEGQAVNFANYWAYGVATWSEHQEAAWALIQLMASKDGAKFFTTAAKRPTALRSLVNEQSQDDAFTPFAGQVLTAQSWYRGKDSAAAEQALKDAVNAVLEGTTSTQDALNQAAKTINATLK